MAGTRARGGLGRPANAVLNVAAVLGLLCLLVGAVALVSGMRVVIFSTGSMAPGIPAGSLALTVPVAAADIAPGEVISAARAGDGKLVTHRVVSVREQDGLRLATLRGDANAAADGTPYDVTGGAQRLVLAVPGLGAVVAGMRSPWILVAVVALLVLIVIPTRRPAHRRRTEEEEAVSPAAPAAAAPGPGPDGR